MVEIVKDYPYSVDPFFLQFCAIIAEYLMGVTEDG